MKPIIGLDFSIKKPAACIYTNGTYSFMSWPLGVKQTTLDILNDAGAQIIEREEIDTKVRDSSEKMRMDMKNSVYLSNLIVSSLSSEVNLKECYVAFEGLSFASSGNVVLQLSSYKYVLMKVFMDSGVPLEKMYTYAPITIKKTAGCAEKGKSKSDVIDSFFNAKNEVSLRFYMKEHEELFRKKSGMWIEHLDDLIDSYFAVETLRQKLNLS